LDNRKIRVWIASRAQPGERRGRAADPGSRIGGKFRMRKLRGR